MSVKEKVLEVMMTAGKPVSAGEVEQLSGLDRKEVDNAFRKLNKENAIVSQIRCKWEPAKEIMKIRKFNWGSGIAPNFFFYKGFE